jgi:2-polyprenyl-3-methyl-5-hydroxy-6-metoxy-1,4-benzoquinol methylase
MPDERCVACAGELEARPAIRIREFQMFRCRECATWTAMPRPSAAQQSAFHDSGEYFGHPYLAHRRAEIAAIDRRCAAIYQRLGEFTDLAALRGQRALDIGCDTGQFIASAAQQFGIVPAGVDVAHRAVEQAAAAGVEAYCCTLEDAPPSLDGFPVITAIDLIEHVAAPREFFESVRARLRGGGVAYVETPNVESPVYRVGRALCRLSGAHPEAFFRRLFPVEHIQYFSADGLARLAKASGLRLAAQGSRSLPAAEIAVGAVTRAGVSVLQATGTVTREYLLRWAILQKT